MFGGGRRLLDGYGEVAEPAARSGQLGVVPPCQRVHTGQVDGGGAAGARPWPGSRAPGTGAGEGHSLVETKRVRIRDAIMGSGSPVRGW